MKKKERRRAENITQNILNTIRFRKEEQIPDDWQKVLMVPIRDTDMTLIITGE